MMNAYLAEKEPRRCQHCGAFDRPISRQGTQMVGEAICISCTLRLTDDLGRNIFWGDGEPRSSVTNPDEVDEIANLIDEWAIDGTATVSELAEVIYDKFVKKPM